MAVSLSAGELVSIAERLANIPAERFTPEDVASLNLVFPGGIVLKPTRRGELTLTFTDWALAIVNAILEEHEHG